MEIFERIRYARDKALEAERTERQRLKEADTVDLQRAASVRLATRQAVREALDDVLDEHTDPMADADDGSTGEDPDGGSESEQADAGA